MIEFEFHCAIRSLSLSAGTAIISLTLWHITNLEALRIHRTRETRQHISQHRQFPYTRYRRVRVAYTTVGKTRIESTSHRNRSGTRAPQISSTGSGTDLMCAFHLQLLLARVLAAGCADAVAGSGRVSARSYVELGQTSWSLQHHSNMTGVITHCISITGLIYIISMHYECRERNVI